MTWLTDIDLNDNVVHWWQQYARAFALRNLVLSGVVKANGPYAAEGGHIWGTAEVYDPTDGPDAAPFDVTFRTPGKRESTYDLRGLRVVCRDDSTLHEGDQYPLCPRSKLHPEALTALAKAEAYEQKATQ
jgi:hypothetical protein